MDKEKSYDRLVVIGCAIIAAITAIAAAFIQRPQPATVAQEVPEKVVATVAESEISKVQRVLEVGREMIQSTVEDLEGGVSCHEEKTGETVKVTLYAQKEFYPLGRYHLEEAPPAFRLAQGVASLNEVILSLQVPSFWVTTQIRGAADAVLPAENIDYDGLEIDCTTAIGSRKLIPGPRVLDNDLLACARAAKVVEYLTKQKLPLKTVLITGSGLQETGGRYRYVDVTVTFHNVLRWDPGVSFCG
jgi:hypothetical protein